ncbi:hypothetical protein [Salipaludibacillus daqingensis]|uniref:hypothetical protein n=1 Tax=Salipaludibacillus daqingensis TaxID=3041001 RepID=UPI002475F784|nr:hypothetical protein [Salipaludibacillus daqingensis]
MLIIGALLLPFFIYLLITTIKFSKSEESKGERGQKILLNSYKNAFGVFPIVWFIIEIIHRLIVDIPYGTYRDTMWILVLIVFIVYGFSINYYKK